MVREPVVAGQFYPGDAAKLVKELDKLIPSVPDKDKFDAIGAVSPHAGYMYSGGVAGEVYSRMRPRKTYVILSPNHTGYGSRFSLSAEPWNTPLGKVNIDTELADAIGGRSGLIKEDPAAHMREHSIEVQLPFIQTISPSATIVPLTVSRGNFQELKEIGNAIAGAVRDTSAEVSVIASSDMTHYETRVSAADKDHKAIERILALDAEGLLKTVETRNISMCGYVPTVIMLIAAKELGARKAELIRYTDSGEVTGDTDEVVGYAGIVVF